MRTLSRVFLLQVLTLLLVPIAVESNAAADVLVNQPPIAVCVGETFQVGVWYQSYSGGSRYFNVRVISPSGALLLDKTGRAGTSWTFWRLTASRAGIYRTLYRTGSGASASRSSATTVAHACSSEAKYRLSVSISDLDNPGAFLVGDTIVVKVEAYSGAKPVSTGAYVVSTLAPTENSGLCLMGIGIPNPSPIGYCELIFSQTGTFRVSESYGFGHYANLAKAAQEITINPN